MRSSCGFLGEGGAQVRRGRGAKRGELRGAALAGQGRAAPRQPRKVGPPTSVGQQPGPIARFADVGRLSLWRHRDQEQLPPRPATVESLVPIRNRTNRNVAKTKERYPPKSERFVSRCTGDKYRNLHVSFQGVKETGNTP